MERARDKDKKGASPLTYEWLPRSRRGDAPREGTGPPLRPQGCCAPPACDGPCGAGLDPGDHCGPSGRKTRAGPGLPRPGRGASGCRRARRASPTPGIERWTRGQSEERAGITRIR